MAHVFVEKKSNEDDIKNPILESVMSVEMKKIEVYLVRRHSSELVDQSALFFYRIYRALVDGSH